MGDSRLEDQQSEVADLKERVSTAVRVLCKLGLADYLGHASARLPGTDLFVISPRGAMQGSLLTFQASDMVVLDLDGHVIDGTNLPPGEYHIHSEMYRRRPEVMGTIHEHQHMTVAFGIAGVDIKPMHLMTSAVVRRPIPVYPRPHMISTPERGRAVAEIIGDHRACHLKGHGIVAVGNSVENAAMNAIHLEEQARMNYLASQIGKPAILPEDEIEEFGIFQSPRHGGGGGVGAWKYYTSLLET
ncbi:MAG: class II aldolase/adducin family protein [Chloroflexi bacterium]|nr:class II aldolase/adducin family protein [Chloroflexota bacterium]